MIDTIRDRIQSPDQSFLANARQRQPTLTKPPGSLGQLEEIANRLAAIQRTATPRVVYLTAVMLSHYHLL